MAKRKFTKSYSTSEELVKLLQSRGLEINDEQKAGHYLKNIGYYRLSAYMYPFLQIPKHEHLYKQGASEITDELVSWVENKLNNRPRKRLGYLTPNEKFNLILTN